MSKHISDMNALLDQVAEAANGNYDGDLDTLLKHVAEAEADAAFLEVEEADHWQVRSWVGDDKGAYFTNFGPFPDGVAATVWMEKFLAHVAATAEEAGLPTQGFHGESMETHAEIEPVMAPGEF